METPLPTATAFVLLAAHRERSLAPLLDAQGYTVLESPTGAHALKWARTIRPDLIVLEEELPDIGGTAICRLLRSDPEGGHSVPILIVTGAAPTPEQRVAALSAGAWDFLRVPGDGELALRLDAYVQAKRSMDVALADSSIISPTALYGRGGLTRRAREFGALMVRCRAPLACVAFEIDADHVDPRLGTVIAHAARVSDVVGVLAPNLFAVVAPATGDTGAVTLARRVAAALAAVSRHRSEPAGIRLLAGYDAVNTFAYEPMDPALLLAHAEHALRTGRPDTSHPWVRRHEPGVLYARADAAHALAERRVGS